MMGRSKDEAKEQDVDIIEHRKTGLKRSCLSHKGQARELFTPGKAVDVTGILLADRDYSIGYGDDSELFGVDGRGRGMLIVGRCSGGSILSIRRSTRGQHE